MVKPHKRIALSFLFLGALILNGCETFQGKDSQDIKPVVNTTYISASDNTETSPNDKKITPEISTSNDLFKSVARGVELKTFSNNTYGYTMLLPKSWGAISHYSGHYSDNINDQWE